MCHVKPKMSLPKYILLRNDSNSKAKLIADPSLNDTKSICRSVTDPYMNDDNWQILTPILSYKIMLICNNNSPINYIERE